MLFGYSRVSTADQNADLQVDALTRAGCDRIFTDVVSGAAGSLPQLENLLSHLREGDTLVVWKLDRLGRTLKNLINLVEDLKQRNIGFKSLSDGFDTTTSGGKFFFTSLGR